MEYAAVAVTYAAATTNNPTVSNPEDTINWSIATKNGKTVLHARKSQQLPLLATTTTNDYTFSSITTDTNTTHTRSSSYSSITQIFYKKCNECSHRLSYKRWYNDRTWNEVV